MELVYVEDNIISRRHWLSNKKPSVWVRYPALGCWLARYQRFVQNNTNYWHCSIAHQCLMWDSIASGITLLGLKIWRNQASTPGSILPAWKVLHKLLGREWFKWEYPHTHSHMYTVSGIWTLGPQLMMLFGGGTEDMALLEGVCH